MTIHSTDPFATPEGDRSPVRRLRGRLPAGVTLWTAPGPAGLTVSSTLVVDGEPAHLLGHLDDESDLWTAIETAGVFAVTLLARDDTKLADRFAGLMPSPGGLFAQENWRETAYGPVPARPVTWAGCRLAEGRPLGWGLLVDGTVETVEPAAPGEPLIHHRGRYHGLR